MTFLTELRAWLSKVWNYGGQAIEEVDVPYTPLPVIPLESLVEELESTRLSLMSSVEETKAEMSEALSVINARLLEQTVRLEVLLEGVHDSVFKVDHQGTILSFNPSAETLFGYAENSIVGRPFSILFCAHTMFEDVVRWVQRESRQYVSASKVQCFDDDVIAENYAHYLATADTFLGKSLVMGGVTSDGKTLKLDVFLNIANPTARSVEEVEYLVTVRDITTLSGCVEELERKQQEFSETVRALTDYVLICNSRGEILSNDHCRFDLAEESIAEALAALKPLALSHGRATKCVEFMTDYGPSAVDISVSRLQQTGTLTVIRDVSMHINTLQLATAFGTILHATPLKVVVFDHARRVTFANEAFCTAVGESPTSIVGRHASEVLNTIVLRALNDLLVSKTVDSSVLHAVPFHNVFHTVRLSVESSISEVFRYATVVFK